MMLFSFSHILNITVKRISTFRNLMIFSWMCRNRRWSQLPTCKTTFSRRNFACYLGNHVPVVCVYVLWGMEKLTLFSWSMRASQHPSFPLTQGRLNIYYHNNIMILIDSPMVSLNGWEKQLIWLLYWLKRCGYACCNYFIVLSKGSGLITVKQS